MDVLDIFTKNRYAVERWAFSERVAACAILRLHHRKTRLRLRASVSRRGAAARAWLVAVRSTAPHREARPQAVTSKEIDRSDSSPRVRSARSVTVGLPT